MGDEARPEERGPAFAHAIKREIKKKKPSRGTGALLHRPSAGTVMLAKVGRATCRKADGLTFSTRRSGRRSLNRAEDHRFPGSGSRMERSDSTARNSCGTGRSKLTPDLPCGSLATVLWGEARGPRPSAGTVCCGGNGRAWGTPTAGAQPWGTRTFWPPGGEKAISALRGGVLVR